VSDYQLIVTPPARRALSKTLPEPIARAAIEFLTGSLVAAPHRVGRA
jgi:mRNA interferase RelE/StbE